MPRSGSIPLVMWKSETTRIRPCSPAGVPSGPVARDVRRVRRVVLIGDVKNTPPHPYLQGGFSRFGLPVSISDIGLFGIVTFPETAPVFKILKWLFILAFILAIAGAFWVVFALWTGIYTVYTYPP